MTRSPLFYPLSRGADIDAGGVADLQTDVMRFMAILALCLVAIFALVQSISLTPAPPKAPEPLPVAQQPVETPQVPEPAAEPVAKPIAEPKPLPDPEAKLETEPPPVPRTGREPPPEAEPEPQVVAALARTVRPAEPTPRETEPQAVTEGFTLRFESDLALTRLVARNEVGLYAITPDKSLRMSVNRGQFSFWRASVPNQFHEMDPATVPEAVVGALRRAGVFEAHDATKWGVTIPTRMRQQLDQYLNDHRGGTLIIGPDGNLRLEP